MPTMCGEFKAAQSPTGGGMHVTETEVRTYYTDGTSDQRTERNWYKSRMVFPLIRIGEKSLEKAFVASDGLGHQIGNYLGNLDQNVRVCLYYYGHLLTKEVIIGLTSETGENFVMPTKGFISGLFWYAVFSPIIVSIPAAFIGMLVGSVGGRRGTAMGLLFGVLYAVGISWYSGLRLYRAYGEMKQNLQPRSS